MKYAIVTFGCRVNQADSLAVEEQLRRKGATPVPPEEADLLIVNSCSVTASADQGTRQTIRRIARANPEVRVVVTGCYATREPREVRALPNVVRVVSNSEKESLVDALEITTAQRFGDGDGACVVACPSHAISLSGSGWTLDVGACIFCGACARACRRGALTLGNTIELATRDRRGLVIERRIGVPK